MTHSTAINSTITKENQATNVSPFEQSGVLKNEMVQSEKHLLASTNMKKEHYKMKYRLLRFTRQVILFEMKTELKTMAESAPLLKAVCDKLHPSCSFSSGCDIYGMGNTWLINRLMNVNKLDGMTALLIAGEFSLLPKSQFDDRFSATQKKDRNFMWYQELDLSDETVFCSKYIGDEVLPNEDGKCSLCEGEMNQYGECVGLGGL